LLLLLLSAVRHKLLQLLLVCLQLAKAHRTPSVLLLVVGVQSFRRPLLLLLQMLLRLLLPCHLLLACVLPVLPSQFLLLLGQLILQLKVLQQLLEAADSCLAPVLSSSQLGQTCRCCRQLLPL
jgi:hypothetical protein